METQKMAIKRDALMIDALVQLEQLREKREDRQRHLVAWWARLRCFCCTISR